MRPLDVFVAPEGNAFMRDIASWIAEAGHELGRDATLHTDGAAPSDPDAINLVVAPHEFYLLSRMDDREIDHAARISIPVCTEQPGTPWFDIGEIVARPSVAALDINAHGVTALQGRGVDASHVRLGGVPSMSAANRERDLDLLFLGGNTDRRAARLAALAPLLWDRDVDLRLFSFSRPVQDGAPGLVFGPDKYELLARSRILLNLHRDDVQPGYFEWARFVEAMANGCCVVTEPVADHAPYVAGTHFIATDDIEGELARLLEDPDECARIGDAARHAVMSEHPLASALGPELERLDAIEYPLHTRRRRPPKARRQMIVAQQHPLLPVFRPTHQIRYRIYEALTAETLLQREIEQARCLARHGTTRHVELTESVSYPDAKPQVSVVVTLFNYAHLVIETVESIAASTGIAFEIVVVDDHSTDDGRELVAAHIDSHPDVPILLVGSDVNQGLPAARNLGFEHARADKVMVMDADNLVYPNALRVLADALDTDERAAFAYSTLEQFGVSPGIRSGMAWNVPRLCEGNYIDAQAMIRKSAWERVGRYGTDDELVFGWEDWELWLRFAAAGDHGVHVSRMLGRYRSQDGSMLATTNLVADHMHQYLREVYPDLPWPPSQ